MKLSAPTTAATLALATPLHAATLDEYCAAYGDMAYRIMLDRQEGVAMSEQMKNTGGVEWVKLVIIYAYKDERWLSDDYQIAAAENYRNELEGYCYEWGREGEAMPWEKEALQ